MHFGNGDAANAKRDWESTMPSTKMVRKWYLTETLKLLG